MKKIDVHICSKCRFLVSELGFLFRKNKHGPCDKCLGSVTTMQEAIHDKIWTKYIPLKEENRNGRTEARKEIGSDAGK